MRQYSTFDLILNLTSSFLYEESTSPEDYPHENLTKEDKKKSIGLMRVNHSGEVAAQALYYGQALATHSEAVKEHLLHAADEEQTHLIWCRNRVHALGGTTSYFNPLWFVGSFSIGYLVGKMGDATSLGFINETEHQVGAHLDKHLSELPEEDRISRAIVKQMKTDELKHADDAMKLGGKELPFICRKAMQYTSKFMTTLSRLL